MLNNLSKTEVSSRDKAWPQQPGSRIPAFNNYTYSILTPVELSSLKSQWKQALKRETCLI